MRLTLLAVGRLRGGPLQALLDDYGKRLGGGPLGPLTVKEVEERRALPAPALKAREGKLLLKALPKHARLIALDEGGRSLDSRGFAALLGRWHEEGVAETAFAIGGADGLDEAIRQHANLTLSLGALTWPHMLVRLLLAEQLYRANAILQGHPYHRD
jgi:23S rRNA (pseudouridine1915-N3)-methyltransferase